LNLVKIPGFGAELAKMSGALSNVVRNALALVV
jgi:hypothetical protein